MSSVSERNLAVRDVQIDKSYLTVKCFAEYSERVLRLQAQATALYNEVDCNARGACLVDEISGVHALLTSSTAVGVGVGACG